MLHVSQQMSCIAQSALHLSPVNCQGCRTSSCLSKGVALQGGGVAATLASVALHCATMPSGLAIMIAYLVPGKTIPTKMCIRQIRQNLKSVTVKITNAPKNPFAF